MTERKRKKRAYNEINERNIIELHGKPFTRIQLRRTKCVKKIDRCTQMLNEFVTFESQRHATYLMIMCKFLIIYALKLYFVYMFIAKIGGKFTARNSLND